MTYNVFMLVMLLRFGKSEPSPLKSEILLSTDYYVKSSRLVIEKNENPLSIRVIYSSVKLLKRETLAGIGPSSPLPMISLMKMYVYKRDTTRE